MIGHRPADGPGLRQSRSFGGRHLRRVDQAPAAIQRQVGAGPFHGPRPPGGLNLDHLGELLGDVNVDRAAGHPGHTVQRPQTYGPQAVRRSAEDGIRHPRQRPPRALQQLCIDLGRRAKAQLPPGKCPAIDPALFVDHRQVGQTQPRLARSLNNSPRHLGRIGVGASADRVVQVVKLTHRRKPGLGHLDHRLRGNRLHVFGLSRSRKRYIKCAPGPETVLPCRPALGQTGHRALEGVGVQVDRRGQDHAVPLPFHPRCHLGDPATVDT